MRALAPIALALLLPLVPAAPARADDDPNAAPPASQKDEKVEQLSLMNINGIYLRVDALGEKGDRIRVVLRRGPRGASPEEVTVHVVPEGEGYRRADGKPNASTTLSGGEMMVRLGDEVLFRMPFSGSPTATSAREFWRRLDALRAELRAHPDPGFEVDHLIEATDLFVRVYRLRVVPQSDLDETLRWLGRALEAQRAAYEQAAKKAEGMEASAKADSAIRSLAALARAVDELHRMPRIDDR